MLHRKLKGMHTMRKWMTGAALAAALAATPASAAEVKIDDLTSGKQRALRPTLPNSGMPKRGQG
jgi:hypothetical protein